MLPVDLYNESAASCKLVHMLSAADLRACMINLRIWSAQRNQTDVHYCAKGMFVRAVATYLPELTSDITGIGLQVLPHPVHHVLPAQ